MKPETTHIKTDIAILGSGFAGSLLALILDKIGLKTVVIDKATHPRFTIGESSTPIGNMILREIAKKYNLPQLEPLTTFGSWQDTYPHLVNGRKRGFSYFQHVRDEFFTPTPDHANELLVTASTDDYRCDTHWLRADVDHFLIQEVKHANIPVFEGTRIRSLNQAEPAHQSGPTHSTWRIKADKNGKPITVDSAFMVDATGSAGLVARHLNLPDATHRLKTNSHALFSHFEGLPTWHDASLTLGVQTDDHPYLCDNAAVHQCIDHGWMWMLRFVNGRVSAGFALDSNHYRMNYAVSPEQAWHTLLAAYPSLDALFESAQLAEAPGKLYRTGRLQRLWGQAAGPSWALLPHTAGFIDPLHSTGIAHSLSGIEQLAEILATSWGQTDLNDALATYSNTVIREIELTDYLVAGCYPCFGQFDLLTSYTMLYFAAAITYEERRMTAFKNGTPFQHYFLCADEEPLVNTIQHLFRRIKKITAHTPTPRDVRLFREETKP